MVLNGEGGGFMRIFVAFACFVFAWGAWENWASVRLYGRTAANRSPVPIWSAGGGLRGEGSRI